MVATLLMYVSTLCVRAVNASSECLCTLKFRTYVLRPQFPREPLSTPSVLGYGRSDGG